MLKKLTCAIGGMAALAVVALEFPAAQAATLTPGFNPALLSPDTVGARYRGQNTGNEHYAGVNDLGVGANRNEASFVWVNGIIPFEFTYDSATGAIVSTLNNINVVNFSSPAGLVSDVLQLTLSNRSKNDAVFTITDLTVNSESLSDLTCDAFCDWMVTDFAVLPLLTVAGNINFDGTMNFNDGERVKFQVNASTVAPIPVPAALPLFLGGLASLGFVGWRRRRKQNTDVSATV